MRALVISETHFGAWTGEDLLRGNHDHHLIAQQAQDVLELALATDGQRQRIRQLVSDRLWFRRQLERRLDGVQVELHYQHAEGIVDNVASPARAAKRLGIALAQGINGDPGSGAGDSRAATRKSMGRVGSRCYIVAVLCVARDPGDVMRSAR